jgi:twitching motility two-component system response regulator PilG
MLHKVSLRREVAEDTPPCIQRASIIQGDGGMNTISSQTLQPAHLSQPSQKCILIIDDSATVRKIIETCLSRENFVVKGFSDGVEAMRWLALPESPIPDLVWLDVGLPKMDGYAVAHYLKSRPRFRDTAIVMLTRRNGIIDRLKGRLAGATCYLTKPFKTQEIVSVTQSLLGMTPCKYLRRGRISHDM